MLVSAAAWDSPAPDVPVIPNDCTTFTITQLNWGNWCLRAVCCCYTLRSGKNGWQFARSARLRNWFRFASPTLITIQGSNEIVFWTIKTFSPVTNSTCPSGNDRTDHFLKDICVWTTSYYLIKIFTKWRHKFAMTFDFQTQIGLLFIDPNCICKMFQE